MSLSPHMLKILACPEPDCHGAFDLRDDRLICQRCGRRYRIDQGLPELIPEEAESPPANE